MVSNTKLKKYGRWLCFILRRAPPRLSVPMDADGWIPVSWLLELNEGNKIALVTIEDLKAIVAKDSNDRFSLTADNSKIRCKQGHFTPLASNMVFENRVPPKTLYHGTSVENLKKIMDSGAVLPQSRLYIQLTEDFERATEVGARHGDPIVLAVDTAKVFDCGFVFSISENNVWQTTVVPVECFHEVLNLEVEC